MPIIIWQKYTEIKDIREYAHIKTPIGIVNVALANLPQIGIAAKVLAVSPGLMANN